MIIVTAAIIFNISKEVLITRRKKGKHLAGNWEFPGGKVEHNESEEECLLREIKEELGIQIQITGPYLATEHSYERGTILLKSYLANYLGGEIKLVDHDDFKWVLPFQLKEFIMAPADIPIVKKLNNEF